MYIATKHKWQYKFNNVNIYEAEDILTTEERYPTVSQILEYLHKQQHYSINYLDADHKIKKIISDPLYRFLDVRIDGENYITLVYSGVS